MATTYTLISSNVLTSSATSITFSSIPATYTDLVIRASVRDNVNSNGAAIAMTFNGSTTNYSGKIIYGDGVTPASTNLAGLTYGWAGTANYANYTANTFASHEIYIPSYTSSNYKSYSAFSVVETNASLAEYMVQTAGLWQGTTAISSINLALSSANSIFAAGSSFYLYGISNA
jgi:hypothetical protein